MHASTHTRSNETVINSLDIHKHTCCRGLHTFGDISINPWRSLHVYNALTLGPWPANVGVQGPGANQGPLSALL